MSQSATRYRIAASETVDRTIEMAAVPAPTFHEGARAEILRTWWTEKGLTPVTDKVGNVWAEVQPGSGPALAICAHMDTVFGEEVTHGVRAEGDLLIGPGVGDDTIALAALTQLPDLLPEDIGHTWLLATVAEEGLGNLTGIRHALEHPQVEIGSVIALEGNYLERVVAQGVGSVRWRVTFEGPGGHAWEAADQPSAVHEMARAVTALDAIAKLPNFVGRCALNVGTMSGGDAINARARHAEMQVDMRSSDPEVLVSLEQRAKATISVESAVDVRFEEIGHRPAGSIDSTHPLVVAALDALTSVGLSPVLESASTDANAAYERGIPAITIGVTTGEKEHTEQEWVSVAPIAQGLQAMVRTIINAKEVGQ